jgi:hypothetical protein
MKHRALRFPKHLPTHLRILLAVTQEIENCHSGQPSNDLVRLQCFINDSLVEAVARFSGSNLPCHYLGLTPQSLCFRHASQAGN